MLVSQEKHSVKDRSRVSEVSLPRRGMCDLAALRMVLCGDSVVDLPRLWFTDRDAIDQFLRLHEIDSDNPLDVQRTRELHYEAIHYLADNLHYDLPREVEMVDQVHELFEMASFGDRRLKRASCMTLKTMHIMNHIRGQELLFRAAIPEARIFDLLNVKIFHAVDKLREAGVRVEEFAASVKSNSSLVTKLLAKRTNHASEIFDKRRFRLIVNSRQDLVMTLLFFLRSVFPFNLVVPHESHNSILSVKDLAVGLDLPEDVVTRFWAGGADHASSVATNEFSGANFRSINFVVDIPLRVDELVDVTPPCVAFAQTEIQLVDATTARRNNQGDSAHEAYKARQVARVKKRLDGDGWDAND